MSMSMKKKSPDVERIEQQRLNIVNKVIEDMKKDGLRWSEPYLPALSPHNPATGTVYHGGNRLHLAFVAASRGFDDSRWCTFNQIRDKGWHLKKGAKSALIEKWKTFAIMEENEETGEKEITGRYPRLVGCWRVFNACEVEGIPPEVGPHHVSDHTASIAENLIASSRCLIIEHPVYAGQAAYAPLRDRILIAPRATFRSDETFTRVLMHEMTHSTGHPDALNRPSSTKFGSPEYAQEELVAELGSLFMSADLGIQSDDMEGEFYENHVSYLKSWIGALENDPDYLFKAASQADRASAYLEERYDAVLERGLEKELEDPELAQSEFSLKSEAAAMREAAAVQEGRSPSILFTVPSLQEAR